MSKISVSDSGKSPVEYHACHSTGLISEVVLAVTDLGRSVDFYHRVLGFELLTSEPGRAVFQLDLGHTLILQSEGVRGLAPPNAAGVYHIAYLYPSRQALGAVYRRLTAAGHSIDGAGDHNVSEALYLSDPDSIGIELYYDRPVAGWPLSPQGRVNALYTLAVDLDSLYAEPEPVAAELAAIGHVHLIVSDFLKSTKFFVDALDLTINIQAGEAVFGTWNGYHHDLAYRHIPGVRASWPQDSVGLKAFTLRGISDLEMVEVRETLDRQAYPWHVVWHGIQVMSPDGILISLTS